MLFRNPLKDPKAMMSVGMLFLVIALMLPRFFHPTAKFGQDWFDGVRGLFFGLSFGMNIGSVILAGRRRRDTGA